MVEVKEFFNIFMVKNGTSFPKMTEDPEESKLLSSCESIGVSRVSLVVKKIVWRAS